MQLPPKVFARRFAERRVRLGGQAWGVIDAGGRPGAPVLVLLPGTLGTAAIFRHQIAALSGRARVVALTYPAEPRIARLADALARLLARLGIGRASIAGSSLGGYLAQIFAARHPGRVRRLFIGNSLVDPPLTRRLTGRDAVQAARLPASAHLAMVLGSVRRWPEPEPAVAALKRELTASGRRQIGPRALKARVLAVQAGPAVPALSLPPGRVVLIDCADDPLLPRAVQDDVVRRYPGAAHYRLAAGGHYPYLLRPAAYTAILQRHMA